MSEGNIQITLHDESIDKIVSVLRRDDAVPGQDDRDTIARTIEAQR